MFINIHISDNKLIIPKNAIEKNSNDAVKIIKNNQKMLFKNIQFEILL